MSFQSTVNAVMGLGVVGELLTQSPVRSASYKLYSAAQAQIVGYAFTVSSEGTAQVGGTGVFAGILADPKAYASRGTSAGGSLAATLTLADYEQGELVTMGTMIVSLAAAAAIGDLVFHNTTTGALTTKAPIAAFTAAQATTVLTVSAITAGNLGVGSIVTSSGLLSVIESLGTGTGGTGTYNVSTSQTVGSEAMTATTVAASGTKLVPNCVVDLFTVSGAGLAVVTLTN